MKMRIFGLAAAAAFAAGPGLAAGDPDAAHWLVEGFCSTCHAVPGMLPPTGAPAGPAPSFQSMADQPDVYTHERLTTALESPHYPMERFHLSAEDIVNLVSYIESLRRPSSQRSELELGMH